MRRWVVGLMRARCLASTCTVVAGLLVVHVQAQESTTADAHMSECGPDPSTSAPSVDLLAPPVTTSERLNWIVGGVIGPRSLGVGIIAGGWQTALDVPEEWQRTWSGFGKRYLEREADVAISNALEGGLGALWGEDPRFVPSQRTEIGARVGHAFKTVVLAPRRDGHLAPAWGRFAGNIVNNVIENAWLPPSVTTPGQTAWRSASGLIGRLIGNLWDEFWPDVRRHVFSRDRRGPVR